jgi:phosphatidate cytidylyltransferase
LVLGALGAIIAGGIWFRVSILVVAVLMAVEWGALIGREERRLRARWLVATPVVAAIGVSFGMGPGIAIGVGVIGALLSAIVASTRGIATVGWMLTAVLSTTITGVALIWLRELPEAGLAIVIWMLATVSATDIGAYLVGRAVGGPKLCPSISPRKTWSGAVGGVCAAVVVAVVTLSVSAEARPEVLVPAAILLSMVGQIGDLLESALKRNFKVKDSGGLIPGHGGVLDRVDAQMTVIPVVALAVLLSGGSVLAW